MRKKVSVMKELFIDICHIMSRAKWSLSIFLNEHTWMSNKKKKPNRIIEFKLKKLN